MQEEEDELELSEEKLLEVMKDLEESLRNAVTLREILVAIERPGEEEENSLTPPTAKVLPEEGEEDDEVIHCFCVIL